MHTPKISEIEKEFDKRFHSPRTLWIKDILEKKWYGKKDVKNFIRQSILSILDSIPLEEEIPKLGSENQDEYIAYTNGYNQKTREIKNWKDNLLK